MVGKRLLTIFIKRGNKLNNNKKKEYKIEK